MVVVFVRVRVMLSDDSAGATLLGRERDVRTYGMLFFVESDLLVFDWWVLCTAVTLAD